MALMVGRLWEISVFERMRDSLFINTQYILFKNLTETHTRLVNERSATRN